MEIISRTDLGAVGGAIAALAVSASLGGGYGPGLIVLACLSTTTLALGWRWRAEPATPTVPTPRLAEEAA